MPTLQKSTRKAIKRGREMATEVGGLTKQAARKAAKAALVAGVATGTAEFMKGFKKIQDAPKRRRRAKIAAVAGIVAVTAAGIAIARSRRER
jgi:uncharacterized membrane protein (UPF0136 family)